DTSVSLHSSSAGAAAAAAPSSIPTPSTMANMSSMPPIPPFKRTPSVLGPRRRQGTAPDATAGACVMHHPYVCMYVCYVCMYVCLFGCLLRRHSDNQASSAKCINKDDK